MTSETYLQRVRALLPALRERAAHAEQLRRLPDETVADFQEAGLFRCLQPKRYGGFELDPGILYQAIIEIGAVCGSSAWVLGVIGIHNWHLGLFAPEAQDDVWGKDTSIQLSTSLAPTGTVERADRGFRLRGRWSFSSGCDFCHWAVLGGIVPPLEKDAPPDARTFLVPRSDYVIDDTWYTVGLCGTGSKDLVVDNAFVPEYRTHSYRDAFYLTNPGAVVNETTTRISPRDKSRVAEDPFAQFALAEAAAEVTAARDSLLANFAEAMRLVRAGSEIPLAKRARYRWDTAKATDRSVRAVDRLFEASGGRGIFLDNPIQRAWRDVHAIRAHAGNNLEKAAFVFGRSEFGLPPLDLRF